MTNLQQGAEDILWGAHASRQNELCHRLQQMKVRDREDAIASTRDAHSAIAQGRQCATRKTQSSSSRFWKIAVSAVTPVRVPPVWAHRGPA